MQQNDGTTVSRAGFRIPGVQKTGFNLLERPKRCGGAELLVVLSSFDSATEENIPSCAAAIVIAAVPMNRRRSYLKSSFIMIPPLEDKE